MLLSQRSPKIKRELAPALSFTSPKSDCNDAPSPPPDKPQVAVFITHGMGQQVPFETIDSAAEGLINSANDNGNSIQTIRLRTVQIDGLKTQRAEFDMRDELGKDVEVHIYEGYWAPITEGQTTLRDAMTFLLSAGFKGIMNAGLFCARPFERWIFGRSVPFGTQARASLHLLATLGVLLSLAVLNAITTTVAAAKILHTGNSFALPDTVFNLLTSVAAYYLLFSTVLGFVVFLLTLTKKKDVPASRNSAWQSTTYLMEWLLWLWIIVTILTGILMMLIALNCIEPEYLTSEWFSRFWFFIWALLLSASWYIKKLIVQYLGDVAAYVDAHSLDRFADIRNRIKTRVFEYAKAVYSQPYERIAMIGHSLGSAVTYDTLNALINHDVLNPSENLKVVERTKLLLTFGSPLDKFAFIFASQKSKTTETREALAATLQPLIQSYAPFRSIKWVNLYAPRDYISGKLHFYDDKKNPQYQQRKIINVIDKDALIPLAAHNEYWKNPTLFDQLYRNL